MLKKPIVRKKMLIALGSLIAIGVIGIALAVGVSANSTPRHRRSAPVPGGNTRLSASVLRQSAQNKQRLVRTFPILARARAASAAVALPVKTVERITTLDQSATPQGRIAPNPALATYVGSVDAAALGGAMQIWLIPGASGVCIAEVAKTSTSTTCASDQEAAAGGLNGLLKSSGGAVTDFGVLPGSATSATVTDKNGTTATISVTNGLWAINDDSQATSVSAPGLSSPVALSPAPGSH